MARNTHLQDELTSNSDRVKVETRYGPVIGGKAANGCIVFLEIPYASPPKRFEDPQPLPDTFRYPKKEYICESAYAVQPRNDGQAAGLMPFEDKVGFGSPTENPLFLNIHVPPSPPLRKSRGFPVRVYIHGGFLQFGSPHSLFSQAQYIAAERSEIWVNIGYRLSAFGFLASSRHKLTGNYGFKDQWLVLQWVKENIAAFGGNPDDIQISGLSAGAHSVHQILHHVSTLPPNEPAPFSSAVLQSNAILTDPKTPCELDAQFDALCNALSLDPKSPDVLSTLKDETKVPWSSITEAIENEKLERHGTFRGCLSEDWILASPGPMERQRTGAFSQSLREHGVQYVVVGEVSEEWFLYSIAHSCSTPSEFIPNLERYFSPNFVSKLLSQYPPLSPTATPDEIQKRFGDILSCAQVYLPVRILARDLQASGYPVLRYRISWTPEQGRPQGWVTHATDRVLWALRLPSLTPPQAKVARAWLDRVDSEIRKLKNHRDVREILCLDINQKIGWRKDGSWEEMIELGNIILSTSLRGIRALMM